MQTINLFRCKRRIAEFSIKLYLRDASISLRECLCASNRRLEFSTACNSNSCFSTSSHSTSFEAIMLQSAEQCCNMYLTAALTSIKEIWGLSKKVWGIMDSLTGVDHVHRRINQVVLDDRLIDSFKQCWNSSVWIRRECSWTVVDFP
jgi:hypothetical protein